MSYYPENPNRVLRPRPDHYQTRSQEQFPSKTSNQTPSANTKIKSLSLRLPRGTSINLYSVISKFEALDALSLPAETPVRRPAPLQIPSKSTRRRGDTGPNQQKRLTTAATFWPSDEDQDRKDILICSQAAVRDLLAQSSEPGGLPRYTASNNPSNIKVHSGLWGFHTSLPGNPNGILMSKNEPSENKHPKTVRDMISLYDGRKRYLPLISHFLLILSYADVLSPWIAASAAVNTPAKLSLIETPKSPLSQIRRNVDKPFSISNNLSSMHKVTLRKSVEVTTLTEHSPSVMMRKRNLIFGPATPNAVLVPTSPSILRTKSFNTDISYNDKTKRQYCARKSETSQVRSPRGYTQSPASKTSPEAALKGKEMVQACKEPGRKHTRLTVNKDSRCVTNRKISDKIEKLYRAKSLEREKGLSQDQDNRLYYTKSRWVKKLQVGGAKRPARHESNGKIASLRNLFEKAPALEYELTTLPVPSTKSSVEDLIELSVEANAIRRSPPTSTPPPPPLPAFKTTRTTSNVSPKTVPQPGAAIVSPISNGFSPVKQCHSTGRGGQLRRTDNKTVWDKVRIFEVIPENNEPERPHERLPRFSRKMKRSLVSVNRSFQTSAKIFNIEDGYENVLSGKDLQDIYAEFQGFEEAAKIVNRKRQVEKWNYVVPEPTLTGTDGAASDKNAQSPFTEDLTHMIIKEVDCRLTEPKPLRVVEMKRLMMLCRGRVGVFVMDREKAKVVNSRKLLHC